MTTMKIMNNELPMPVPANPDIDSFDARGMQMAQIDAACSAWLRARSLSTDGELIVSQKANTARRMAADARRRAMEERE